jgi:hypothetical protein
MVFTTLLTIRCLAVLFLADMSQEAFLREAVLFIEKGAPEELNALLQSISEGAPADGVNIRIKDDRTLLYHACFRKQLHCVRILLSHGANPNARIAQEQTLLHLAVLRSVDVLKLLLADEV